MGAENLLEQVMNELSKIYGKPSCLGVLTRVYESMGPEEQAANKELFEKISASLK